MLLRNFDFAAKYLDCESKKEKEGLLNPGICGWYKVINGLLSALLVMSDKLYFLYGDNKFLITDDHKVLLREKNKLENEFTLIDKETELVNFSYPLPNTELNVSPFEYIDEEDFKWGDFIERIVNDSERKEAFIRNLMEDR